jgi:hypothetical protein
MMGKVKEFMRSLRTRLSTSICKASDKSTKLRKSSGIPYVAPTNIDSRSGLTIETQTWSFNEAQKSPNIQSTKPVDPIYSKAVALNRALVDLVPVQDRVVEHAIDLDACAVFEVNVAMLRFVKRLPLDELHKIGRGLTLSSSLTDNDTAGGIEEHFLRNVKMNSSTPSETVSLVSTTGDSSESIACCSLARNKSYRTRCLCRHDQYVAREGLSICSLEFDGELHADSKTLSLTSGESDSTWSFACSAARRVERHPTQRKRDDEANSVGSFACSVNRSGVVMSHNHENSVDARVGDHNRPLRKYIMDRTSRAQRLHSSIADNTLSATHSFNRPTAHMERAPSFTQRSVDSCDLFLESIGLPILPDDLPATSDEDLEDLPNWSDVEDDPEYNQFEERSFHRSDTNSSYSSRNSLRMGAPPLPIFQMPSGFTNCCHNG